MSIGQKELWLPSEEFEPCAQVLVYSALFSPLIEQQIADLQVFYSQQQHHENDNKHNQIHSKY